jgi:hypothetical protein
MRLPETGHLTSAEAAQRLGVDQTRIQTWFHWGVLSGKQEAAQRQLWIAWNRDVAQRMGGNAVLDASMVSVKRLCNEQDKQPGEVLGWASTEGHAIYRVRRGTSFRFYIRPVGSLNRCGQETDHA